MDPVDNAQPATRRPPPHPVFWVIAGALIVIAVLMVSKPTTGPASGVAFGQPVLSGGARGVFAFTGQLGKGTHGIFMVDVDAMTIWAYEYVSQKGCLRLAAGRSWRYDRYLEKYNDCGLPPEAIEQMVEEQRKYRLQSNESSMP